MVNPTLAGGPLWGQIALKPPTVPAMPTATPEIGPAIDLPPVGETGGARSFEGVLGRLVGEVQGKKAEADTAVHQLLSGEDVPLHRVMIATEEASLSFQLMVEVRNKLLDSYQELMRMQV